MDNGLIEAKDIDLFAVRASIREVIVHDTQELMVFDMIEAKHLVMIAPKDRAIIEAKPHGMIASKDRAIIEAKPHDMIAPKDRVIIEPKPHDMIASKDHVIIEPTLKDGISGMKTGTLVERAHNISGANVPAIDIMMRRVILKGTDDLLQFIQQDLQ